MDGLLDLVVVLCIGALSGVKCLDEFSYTREDAFSGFVPFEVSPTSVRSKNQCAAICSLDSLCQGFYYSGTHGNCYIERDITFSSLSSDVEGLYYTKEVPVTTTTAVSTTTTPPTTTTPTTSTTTSPLCSTFYTDVSVTGTSGTYGYHISMTTGNQSEALALCTACGYQLVRLNVPARIHDLRAFLMQSAVFNSLQYWSDAQRYVLEPGTPWKDSYGDIVPEELFCSGTYGNDIGQYCARFSNQCDYKFKDIQCSTTSYGVICE